MDPRPQPASGHWCGRGCAQPKARTATRRAHAQAVNRKTLPTMLRRLETAGLLLRAARVGLYPRYLSPPVADAGPAMRIADREKVFGPGRAVPLDRNRKARIQAYAQAWDRLHRQPAQERGGGCGPSWCCMTCHRACSCVRTRSVWKARHRHRASKPVRLAGIHSGE
jgi:hypothetical protein